MCTSNGHSHLRKKKRNCTQAACNVSHERWIPYISTFDFGVVVFSAIKKKKETCNFVANDAYKHCIHIPSTVNAIYVVDRHSCTNKTIISHKSISIVTAHILLLLLLPIWFVVEFRRINNGCFEWKTIHRQVEWTINGNKPNT